jgi:glycine dehydrogenase subunit 1
MNESLTQEFEIIGVGTTTLSVTGDSRIVSINNERESISSSSSGKVTAKAPASYSSDNTLKSLQISPGTLSPAFSPDRTTYNATVDADVKELVVSAAANPDVIATMQTYCFGAGTELRLVPAKDGRTDLDALKEMLTPDVCCVYVQQPNFYGQFEEAEKIAELTHAGGAKYIMGVNPIALAIMKTPAECGADIAVGEGQPLGLPLGFGGPYLGFMAATGAMMRKLPGRIVGETVDADGNRAYVLTLQAREQHIRREKASSNICSNEALCALTASVYLAAVGPQGLKQAATLCLSKAHYLAQELTKIEGVNLVYGGEFFHEFVTTLPKQDEVLAALAKEGILGGLPVKEGVLWCVTEKATKEALDKAVAIVKEVCA